ncbi:DNA replication licensing factor MCM5 [Protopterus annectens]|uniref:DNA replication licensing factor MCM5 n=1 Tax=Protopterus annectens TaxID=7888 RepID=UPI001CFAEE84|nr:DNA replication licensing factor MCM5 [Protopterus annectens]
MSGFDDPGIYYSDSFGGDQPADEGQLKKTQIKKRLKEFLRQYRVGTDRTGFTFKYRDELKRHYNLGEYWIEVEMEDLASFDEDMADCLYKQPSEHLPLLEEAAQEVADEVTRPRPAGEETVQNIQVMLRSDANPSSIRNLKSDQMSRLVKIPGIIIAATAVRAKATKIAIQCRSCRNTINNIAVRPGLEGYALPRKCNIEQAGRPKCPVDPYFILPDKCKCVDFQTLKLQESPDAVPHGELPRHMQLYCDRYLCDKVVPGNRVTVMGIYSIKKAGKTSAKGRDRVGVGIRTSYIRVVGIQVDTEGTGRSFAGTVSPQEEEEFRRLAAMPNIYETIAKSIAPSIYGSTDIKKAISCLLFGGSRKRLPDGLTRRGDVNLLMLGDPGTAKSQLLKFVERCSPIGVYTSGKGSSAAGLTASVMRDPVSRNFVMEGGAMVLADGGVVCIDEFDKMREDDRVAIHEAMEQQTISIAKDINYLDILVIKDEMNLRYKSVIYRKPTYSNAFLHFTSCHPNYQKKAVVKDHMVRAARMVSDFEDFLLECEQLSQMFVNRGYLSSLFDIRTEVTNKRRSGFYKPILSFYGTISETSPTYEFRSDDDTTNQSPLGIRIFAPFLWITMRSGRCLINIGL